MPLADIIFNRNQTGIGRPLPNNDHITGLLFYMADVDLPSGFSTVDRIKPIYSLNDAVNLGILNNFSDETKPTGGNYLVTATGSAGDIHTLTIDDVVLGSFAFVSGLVDDVATGLSAAINALTYQHGYTASASTANVVLTSPVGVGKTVTVLGKTLTGTADGTLTQFSGGKGSFLYVMHYHISEYFRIQPNGKLYLGIYTTPAVAYDGTGISLMQNFAGGALRQIGVFVNSEVITTGAITLTQAILTTLETGHMPLNAIMHVDCTGKTLSTLSDLSALSANRVSVVIGSDGNWHQLAYDNTKAYLIGDKVKHSNKVYICKSPTTGDGVFNTLKWTVLSYNIPAFTGYTISCLGTLLGTVSVSIVHENVGWAQKYNIASGNIMDVAAFVTGELYSAQSSSLLNTINNAHYIFVRHYIGITGTYFQDSWSAVSQTNDFAHLEMSRTMDKAVRNIRTTLLPDLKSPLYVDATTGKLSESTIAVFKNKADKQLEIMEIAGEISGGLTTINPDQSVLTTEKLTMGIKIVPVGSTNEIEINIGFALSLTQ